MLGAALGIASSFAGNIANNRNIDTQVSEQRKENQANRDWNLNLAKMQNNWNIEQWNRENAYNSPAAQMARYKAAGLNPDLMYGQQNLSAASPEMTAGEGSQPTDVSNLANKRTVGDMITQAATTRLTNAQAKLAESQADKVDAETVGQTINNDWLPKLLKGQTEINEADVRQKLADAGLKGKQIEVATEQIKVMQQSVKESQAKINDLQSQMENRTFQQVQAMLEYNLRKDKQRYEISEILSKVSVNRVAARRIISLLPYEIAESISRAGANDASAALTFLKQGTEQLIQENTRLSNSEKKELIQSLQTDNLEKALNVSIRLNGEGKEHLLSQFFNSLGYIIQKISPLK